MVHPLGRFAALTLLACLPSQRAVAQLFDWRGATPGPTTYELAVDATTATATAYVVELTGGNPVLGPFDTGMGSIAAGFNQDPVGLGLYATPATTTAPIAGSEACCGLVLGGINSDPYLSGNTGVEAMNFVLFQFSAPVDLNTLEVVGVTSQARGVWVATGSTAPDLSGSIEQALTGFSVFNLPDDTGSSGPLTQTFEPATSFDSVLLVPALTPFGLGLLAACMLAVGLRRVSARQVPPAVAGRQMKCEGGGSRPPRQVPPN